METIVKAKRGGFTVVRNDFLRDSTLSWKAKGLITYIMSLPDDWRLNIADLKTRSKDGQEAVMSGLAELIEAGYCRRTMQRNDSGHFAGYRYEVSDTCEYKGDNPKTEEPYTENPYTENPNTENPELINTNINKYLDNNNGEANKIASANPKRRLFRNSEVYSLVKIEDGVVTDASALYEEFKGAEFTDIDLLYYFFAVSDWSDQRNMMRTRAGWLATIRNFIRSDRERGKLHVLPNVNLSGAADFLTNSF